MDTNYPSNHVNHIDHPMGITENNSDAYNMFHESSGHSSSTPFCSSDGMVMYMDGFHRSLSGHQSCLNLYFPSWTLDTRGKFYGAMFGVFALAVVTEGISKLRYIVQRRGRSNSFGSYSTLANNPTRTSNNNSNAYPQPPKILRKRYHFTVIIIFLHGFQVLCGYILMLATMTFSAELLLCVIVGLAFGYGLFFSDDDGHMHNHVTTNPCCNFMQNEMDECTTLNENVDEKVNNGSRMGNFGEDDPEFSDMTTHRRKGLVASACCENQ